MSDERNNFNEFTGLYEISKTLRFELIPQGNTEKLLEENKVFEVDEVRKKKYEDIKPYFNKLHLEFIEFCLNDIILDFSFYNEKLINWKKEKKKDIKNYDGKNDSEKRKNKDKKVKDRLNELIKEEEFFRDKIVGQFNDKSFDFVKKYNIDFKKLKKDEKKDKKNKVFYEFLFEKGIFKLLKEKYQKEKETIKIDKDGIEYSIFDDWDNWMGYLTKFFETRKNLYKSDGTSTALATRIINDNLRRFCENLEIFNKIKEKSLFNKLEEDFDLKLEDFFSLDFYNKCILQEDIDKYNEIIGGTQNKEKDGLNKYINEYRQNNSGEKLSFFQKLDKQILSEKEKFIEQIENEINFKKVLENFLINSKEKVILLENIFGNFHNFKDQEYKKIYFSKIAFNTISHKFTDKVNLFEKNLFEEMKKDKITGIKYNKKEEKYTFTDFIPLYYIKKSLENYNNEELFYKNRYYKEIVKKEENIQNNNGFLDQNNEELWNKFCEILNFEFKNILKKSILDINGEEKKIGYNISKNNLENFLEKEKFLLDEKSKGIIKDFADYSLVLYQMGKYFAVEKKGNWVNYIEILDDFYSEEKENGYFKFYNKSYKKIIIPYNLMRNYISKKPWEDNKKWKLNFENSSLLKGWDKNKETSYSGVILKKDKRYYLCKINNNSVFSDKDSKYFLEDIGKGKYEKMVYKFLKDVSLSVPKNTTQLKDVIKHFKNSDKDYILKKSSSLGEFKKLLKISKRIFELNNKIYLKENLDISVIRGSIKKDDEKKYIKLFQKDFVNLGGDKNIYRKALDDWMNFCRDFVDVYPSCDFFDYSKLKNNEEYKSLDEFYKDLDSFGYKIVFQDISEKYIEDRIKNKELYLFEIHNKDWNLKDGEKKTGTKNLHTIYFENLFSNENKLNNFMLKLNGEAEIFFRPKTEESKLGKKIDNSGKEVIKNKRYSKNKVLFHFPITLNRGTGKITENIFNQKINNFLANNSDINVLGIDRGEKHLAYYSVINKEQKILDSGSLNFIEQINEKGEKIKFNEKKIKEIKNNEGKIIDYELVETGKEVEYIDYKILLDFKEKKRRLERQSWKQVEQIKDLKKGYISAVVNKITNLIIKYNAIIVFEDLNMRFKQIRGGIEKSVYQQLEKALIDKLNFLVKKGEIDPNKAGNLLKAYQLTAPIGSFKDMGKQTGIIFYTQASYTSKIDPLTGWRPNLYLKKGNAKINKENILKFTEIIFNKKYNRFDITYDLKNFFGKDVKFPKKTKWTLSTCVERWKWDRNKNNNKGGYYYFEDLTKEFKKIFENTKYNIDINGNIKRQILNLEENGNKKFFSDFIGLFSLLCQIRNTDDSEKAKKEQKDDIIFSPVEPFFDSRKSEEFGKNLPKNGDDNGGYNIARKGIMILEKIDKWKKENQQLKLEGKKEINNPDLFISNKDWDEFCSNI